LQPAVGGLIEGIGWESVLEVGDPLTVGRHLRPVDWRGGGLGRFFPLNPDRSDRIDVLAQQLPAHGERP
jgi:hypothetical protein